MVRRLVHRSMVGLMVAASVAVPVLVLLSVTAVVCPLARRGGLNLPAWSVFTALLLGMLAHNHAPGRRP